MVKIIVCGAYGKMGKTIIELINNLKAGGDSQFKLIGGVESPKHPVFANKMQYGHDYHIGTHLDSFKDLGDVVIDFTTPQATLGNLIAIRKWKKAAAVVGTTGFDSSQMAMIKRISSKVPIVLSPNMSVGVNLVFDLAQIAAEKLVHANLFKKYDVEIVEKHHSQKVDAPSGTAMELARRISNEAGIDESDYVYGRKGAAGPRKRNEIAIHSVRAGDIVGEHTVLFGTAGERIEITHRATSRTTFALGALSAAAWVHKRNPGLYSMKDVISGAR